MSVSLNTSLVLAVDANVLIGELLSDRGLAFVQHPGLYFMAAEYTLAEVREKVPLRIEKLVAVGMVKPEEASGRLAATLSVVERRVRPVPLDVYQAYEAEARDRIPHDPDDWHTVALALTFDIAVCTNDKRHFFGCGVAVWSTDIPRRHIAAGRV